MGYNKVIYNNEVLIDLTDDTVTEETLFNGITAHDKSGKIITGTLFSGFPDEVRILKKNALESVSKKEKNIVIYNKTLIDLSNDTVSESTLLFGYRSHMKDGTVINGAFLKDYPEQCVFSDHILDSKKNIIKDSNGNNVQDNIVYKKSISGNYIVYKKA